MRSIVLVTLKGIFRDRIFQGIMALSVVFLLIPSVASLSMRQVTELSITLSLSLISFIMLLLAVFLGATSVWRDIERRYTFSVISLPLSRSTYIWGRFLGVALFLVLTVLFLGSMALLSIKFASTIYPSPRPLAWTVIIAAIGYDAMKYIVIVAIALMLSTVSTSFFLPVFGAISAYLAGTASQQVYDYLHTSTAQADVPVIVQKVALVLYYMLPNLAGFDLKVNAIYALPLDSRGALLTVFYFIAYTGILLGVAVALFSRREMK